jgi:NNP family nitrate/nitrite transporter-like MFS transporter
MSGLVGAMGNAGGVFFALTFRLHPLPFGKAFWLSGIVVMVRSLFRTP